MVAGEDRMDDPGDRGERQKRCELNQVEKRWLRALPTPQRSHPTGSGDGWSDIPYARCKPRVGSGARLPGFESQL